MPGQVNPSVLPATEPKSNVWDVCAMVSHKDRAVCKKVVYALLFGASVIEVMGQNELEIGDVVEIRMTFDHYMKHEWKHRND